jgi:Putative bacterial sensory transduction regulator
MASPTSVAIGPRPADVERWLEALGLETLERADREGVVAWDLVLDGRRRHDLRVTLILDPGLGLVCWAHYAPPIGDAFRKSYRKLLRWNDELPFVKFAVSEDDRPILIAELPPAALVDEDALGLALARLLAVSDRFLDESTGWLWLGGRKPAGYDERPARHEGLLTRYANRLAELTEPAAATAEETE